MKEKKKKFRGFSKGRGNYINNLREMRLKYILFNLIYHSILSMSSSNDQKGPPVAYNYTQQVPIEYDHRTCTDVLCIVVGLVFSLIMIILGITLFNYDNYVKSNFATDSDGKLCGVDAPGYDYLYFANPPTIDRRVCVKACPADTDAKLSCYVTEDVGCKYSSAPGFEVQKYDNFAMDQNRGGRFCIPSDETLSSELIANAHLQNRFAFINSLDTMVLSMILSISISVLYVVLVQCFPKAMNIAVPILSLLVILALAICMFTYYADASGKIPIAIILLVAFIIIALGLFRNRNSVRMNGVWMTKATQMLRSAKCGAFLYIPLFIGFLTGFIFLIILEFRAFWTGSSLYFDREKSIFWEFHATAPTILCVLLILQSIWGLSFLKEAFNFVVSGNAVNWYYEKDESCINPFKVLVCKHFGSVIGGSFMTGFFTLGDYIFDLIKPSITSSPTSFYRRTHTKCCHPFKKVFDLVRSDAMAYIHITGNPYCNSARYCEYLCDNSAAVEESQTTSRSYRLSAHMLIAGIVSIICLYVKGKIVPTIVLVMIFLSLFISTFFISIHADAAEAIAISFIDNEECERRRNNLPANLYGDTYNNMSLKQPELAEEVKKMLEEHPYRKYQDAQ